MYRTLAGSKASIIKGVRYMDRREGMKLSKYEPYTKEQAIKMFKAINIDTELTLLQKLQCKKIIKNNISR
jgi:hypothetical protein